MPPARDASTEIGMRAPDPGLCRACSHSRVVKSARGSVFWLCELSRTDPAFPRYPPLPVVRCSGFTPAPPREPLNESLEANGET
ncbi:MAG TPA: hypothetical protein VMN78_10795 [Longimicrobiales bacterium]|nr:hypothetical protein [Longimicrobiales bacterium]